MFFRAMVSTQAKSAKGGMSRHLRNTPSGQRAHHHLEPAHGAGSPELGETHNLSICEALTFLYLGANLREVLPVDAAHRRVFLGVEDPYGCRQAGVYRVIQAFRPPTGSIGPETGTSKGRQYQELSVEARDKEKK